MKKSILKQGFTLVELLVVIAIIALLASALFPAITGAMNQARATTLKNKGRGIWTAILSANMEREPLNLDSLWPADVCSNENAAVTVDKSANAYFTYLLSDGTEANKGVIEQDTNIRLVSDLTPESFIAQGIAPAKTDGAIEGENCAWHIYAVDNNSPAEYPLMITKNLEPVNLTFCTDQGAEQRLNLRDGVNPFGKARAVWVTKGGSVSDARPKYLTNYQVAGLASQDGELTIYPCAE
ncbi:MAG: type II secretion system protein [Kiritimatiellia bacterium]|jgi:prepilin-type N-terminal cleavage/methylation domain-containing protein